MENKTPEKEAPKFLKVTKVKSKELGYKIRRFYIDMENYLQIKSNDKLIQMKLKLKGDKLRLIGMITKSTRTIVMTRKRGIHRYRTLDAYGFNDYVLRNAFTFDTIRLSDDMGGNWKIPRQYILDNGVYLHHKNQGFEKQRFISFSQLEQFKVQPSENRRC